MFCLFLQIQFVSSRVSIECLVTEEKLIAKQKNQRQNVSFNKNVFDLNQKHLHVFHAFRLLKTTKETSGDTQKTLLKTSSFCFVFLVSPELYNNTILHKINTYTKKQYLMVQLKINWRRKLNSLINLAFCIFFQKSPLVSYVWVLFSHIYSIFAVQTCFRLVLHRVDSCRTRVDLC